MKRHSTLILLTSLFVVGCGHNCRLQSVDTVEGPAQVTAIEGRLVVLKDTEGSVRIGDRGVIFNAQSARYKVAVEVVGVDAERVEAIVLPNSWNVNGWLLSVGDCLALRQTMTLPPLSQPIDNDDRTHRSVGKTEGRPTDDGRTQ